MLGLGLALTLGNVLLTGGGGGGLGANDLTLDDLATTITLDDLTTVITLD